MKFYRYENTAVSLQNVQEVNLYSSAYEHTQNKRKVITTCYSIRLLYINGKESRITLPDDQPKNAESVFNTILSALNEED